MFLNKLSEISQLEITILFFRLTVDNFTKIFPTAPGLDQDLGSVGIMLDSCNKDIMADSMELSDYYTDVEKPTGSNISLLEYM